MTSPKIRSLVTTIATMILLMALFPLISCTYSDIYQSADVCMSQDVRSVPLNPVDSSPGYYETSEYLIGSVAVGIIFPESNGTIDPETEDWTTTEETQVINEIETALDWWASQNPDASVSFVTDIHYRVPTSYEPINRVSYKLWRSEVMTNLGYPPPYEGAISKIQVYNYSNDLRKTLNTNWVFTIFVIDSSNDPDGCFPNGASASSAPGGPYLIMTYDNDGWGIDNMDKVCAHEIGHTFWATDEYNGITEYCGYLNESDVEDSGCLMYDCSWCLSEGTKGQIGWRDTNQNGILDIVDTFPSVTLNPYSPDPTTDTVLTYSGSATVVPYPNNNPSTNNPEGRRDVTINKIVNVQWRVDFGQWENATPVDGAFDEAVENFTFTTPSLSLGEHFIEARAINNWGNIGTVDNDTITISELIHDIAITDIKLSKTVVEQGHSVTINVTVENQGNYTETFNVTTYANTTVIGTEEVTLNSGDDKTLTFTWMTDVATPEGNYLISANATIVLGETDIDDNTFTDGWIVVTIPSDTHDVAITSVMPSKTVVGQNYSMPINVTIENQGEVTETFNVTLYANTTVIETREISLTSGDSTTVTFDWNTTAIPLGNYSISANAILEGDINTTDNTFIDGWVVVTIPADINGDGKVDWRDLLILAQAYGSEQGQEKYVPEADINSDSEINWKDLLVLAQSYGKTA